MSFPTGRSVLVVDDEPGMRMALEANFQRIGWTVETARGAQEAVRKFEQKRPELIVTDVRMPDGDGLHFMRSIRRAAPSTAVILLTAYGNVPEAVQAIQDGACDYLMKPISFAQLQSTVERLMRRKAAPAPSLSDTAAGVRLIGNSHPFLKSLERARSAAQTDADILLEAPSGTGKELLARFIHGQSDRATQPFVAVNCAAVPETLLESELFGHAKGAFTGALTAKTGKFELANHGTILLDEISEMPLSLQPKLLRVLQEREVEPLGRNRPVPLDIRVIATTNLSLASLVDTGRFRLDLYYRLNVIPLSLPALSERPEDIVLLAEHFAERIATQSKRATPTLTAAFLERLQKYSWPGNVRELHNFMRRILALNPAEVIGIECIEHEFPTISSVLPPPAAPSSPPPLRELERQLLEETLSMTNGNRTRTAAILGISVRTVRNRIREYGLPPRRYA